MRLTQSPDGEGGSSGRGVPDQETARWLAELNGEAGGREAALAQLHGLLLP